jgi:uncharacterized membrane protein
MREERMTTDRVAAFSDAVFAVIMTIMVLDRFAPNFPNRWTALGVGSMFSAFSQFGRH